MRWLVFLLLLANAVYLGYELDTRTRSRVADTRYALKVPAGVHRLRQLSELAHLPARRPEDEPPAVVSDLDVKLPDIDLSIAGAQGKYNCFTYGPLPEEKHAVWLGDWFRSRNGTVTTRHGNEPGQRLFWVYLAEASRAGAAAVMHDLAAKGISDYRLISRGDLQNSVSLGLFSTQTAVNDRLQELRGKGYRPVVVPYTNVRDVYWLDVRVPAVPKLLDEMFHGFPSRYNSVPVKCNEIAIDQASQ